MTVTKSTSAFLIPLEVYWVFTNETIGVGYNESPNIVNIIQVNSILVNLDIISGSYVNGSASPTIYSFYPNVSPGYKIVERPSPT